MYNIQFTHNAYTEESKREKVHEVEEKLSSYVSAGGMGNNNPNGYGRDEMTVWKLYWWGEHAAVLVGELAAVAHERAPAHPNSNEKKTGKKKNLPIDGIYLHRKSEG